MAVAYAVDASNPEMRVTRVKQKRLAELAGISFH